MSIYSSMWDRIFDCPVPVNRIAFMVVFAKPEYSSSELENNSSGVEPHCKNDAVRGIKDYVDIMLPPPEGLCDYRGRRSFYHIVVGYAYRRTKKKHQETHVLQKIREQYGNKAAVQAKKNGKADRITTWYVLRADGEVVTVNSRSMRSKLRNMDLSYLENIRLGYLSGERDNQWLEMSKIPISATPCSSGSQTQRQERSE